MTRKIKLENRLMEGPLYELVKRSVEKAITSQTSEDRGDGIDALKIAYPSIIKRGYERNGNFYIEWIAKGEKTIAEVSSSEPYHGQEFHNFEIGDGTFSDRN